MKTKKLLYLTFLLFLSMVLSKTIIAQNSCTTAASITVDVATINQSQTLDQNWYLFKATDNYLFVDLFPIDSTFYGIDSIIIYNANCTSLSIVSFKIKNLTDTLNMLELYLDSLIINNNYLIKTTKKSYSTVNYNLAVFKTLASACDLVNNPTFNAFGFGACPTSPGTVTVTGASLTNGWLANNSGTPDFYHSCNTSTASITNPNYLPNGLIPVTGGGYFGLHCGSPSNFNLESMSGSLAVGMTAGKKYYVCMDYAKTPRAKYSVNRLGMSLSLGLPSNTTPGLGFTPIQPWQITSTGLSQLTNTVFVTMGSCYQANGGESYITIGNSASYSTSTYSLVNPTGLLGTSDYLIDNVHAIPLDIDISPSSTICLGATSTLTTNLHCSLPVGVITNTAGVITNSLFVWTPTVGLTSSTGTTTIASPTATTIYTITLTIPPVNSNGSACTITNTVQVTVSSLTVNISASPSQTICLGNSATLTATGASTYTWSTGAATSSISVTPTVTSTYTVTGTNTLGCSSTKTISINVVPNITLTAVASPTTICAGKQTTLTATGATSYTWNPGGLLGASVTVSPTINTTYTVTGSNGTCSNTKTVVVTVNPSPTVAVNNSTICSGNTATLTASGATTYSWNTGATTNTISVAPLSTTIYTVTGTGANGCSSIKTATVTVNPSPTITVNSPSICAGNSANLSASGATTYTWYPGATNGSTLAVTPSVSTNYTVTGTNASGCTSTVVTSVYVYSNPPAPFNIIAPSNVVANGTGTNSINLSTTITNTTGLSFSWFPGGANTPTTNFNLTQPEIISLTITNTVCGGSNTQSICVNYVANTCSNTALPVLNNYTLTSPTQIADGAYFVTGTLTLAWSWNDPLIGSASLDNKSFLMSTGSKVVIPATSKVKIGLSKFYSCSGMWQGIELQSNATDAAEIALGGTETRIEDAYKAITCTNPLSRINMASGVIFNKNYIDIDISFATNSGTSFALNYTPPINYLSESSATSPGGNLKCSSYYTPIVKSRSYAGIKTNNVGILNYNTPCTPANYSVVKNKDYGFYFTNTNANVNNVNFNNAVGIAYSYALNFVTKPAGVGIYSENSGYLNVKPATTPTVGATTTFSNLGYGIITNNTYTVDVQNTNHITAAQSFTQDPSWGSGNDAYVWGGYVMTAGYGLNGIFATNARDVLRINNNTISDNFYPVTVNYTVAPSNTNTMSVAQNTINTINVNGVREGVTFNSALSFTPTPNNMRIAANTFSNVSVGVKVTATSVGLRISNNTFTIHPTATNPKGIYITGSNTVTVDNNIIYGSLTSTSVATWNANHHGILCENSPGCKIQCNTISNVGIGVEYRGGNTSSGAGFFSNILKYPMRRGLFITNGGIIGTQGSSTGASANQWIAGTSAWPAVNTADPNKTSVGGTLTGGSASQSVNSILYVHNNSNELPDDNYITSPSIALDRYILSTSMFTTTAGNYATCPSTLSSLKVAQSGNNSMLDRDADFVDYINTVLPSTNTDVTPQDKYMLKQYMFDELTQNPSANATLINFVNQQQNLSVDVYHDIDSLLANGNVSAASTKNAQASQSNDITQTQNAYNALYINGINSKADLDNLSAIADLCPQLYGNAVYQARALLQSITYVGKMYGDSCDNSKVRKEMWLDDEPTSVSVADGVQAKLYPNPNNGNFMLAYDLKKYNVAEVHVYDVTGKVVFKTHVDNLENMKQINTSNLQSGIYFIQLIHDKNLLWTDKLIISK